jgi:hypothetical protein
MQTLHTPLMIAIELVTSSDLLLCDVAYPSRFVVWTVVQRVTVRHLQSQ